MKPFFTIAVFAALACLSTGCDDATGSGSRPVSTVSIAGDSAGLEVGGTRQMTAVPLTRGGDTLFNHAVAWSSSDSTIAAVSAEGLVTARAVGSVTIRAMIEGQSGEADLTVVPRGFSGKWSSVSVATGRSCALAEGGAAYCWGQRLVFQAAPGSDTVGTPRRVPGPQTFTLVSTAASSITTATCGLTSDGATYCWGSKFGGTRDGRPERKSGPTLTTLAADGDFACGLAAGGEAYCWGPGLEILSSDYGQNPVPSLPGARFTSIALGYGMACGIDTAGATVCNHQRYVTRATNTPVADGFTSVVVGGEFRCGLRSDGQALCSTAAYSGVGGSWGMTGELTPVQAPQPLAQLSAGGPRVCGLTADGLAYCWKVSVYNAQSGGSRGITTPVAVGGGRHFVQIAAADTHACGVTLEGEIYCWGDNGAGELGNGTVGGSSDAPVRVIDPA